MTIEHELTREEREATERAHAIAAHLKLNDPKFREETEYDTYRLLRDHLPAAHLESDPDQPWLVTRYDDCRYIMQNPQLFSSKVSRTIPLNYIPQMIDPPEQREYRKLLEPLFTPALMSELEPDIERYANELIDGMLAAGEFDFMDAFAVPFPTIIFCRLMGLPIEDHHQLMEWELILLHGGSTIVAEKHGIPTDASGRPDYATAEALRRETSLKAVAYLERLLEERRREPTDDLLTKMLNAKYEGTRPLTPDELKNMCFLFFIAGLDTVTGALGLITETFAKQPEDRHRFTDLIDDRQKLDAAVEELLRYHSTVSPGRMLTQGCPVAGVEIPAGARVIASLVSGNRDESAWERPDELVFDRHPNPHLAFTVGIHRCLGIHLARRELRIGLRAIHERMPNYRLQTGKQGRYYTDGLRGLYTLPIAIEP